MHDLLNHQIKKRPFIEENINTKEKFLQDSYENNKKPSNKKLKTLKSSFRIHFNLSLSFLIFLLAVSLLISTNSFLFSLKFSDFENENPEKLQFQSSSYNISPFEILIYNSTMKFNSYVIQNLNSLYIYISGNTFFDSDFSLISVPLIALFLSLLLSILSFSNPNQLICFIFVTIVFISDKYMINLFLPFSSVSFEIINMSVSIYSFCLLIFSDNYTYSNKKWFFILLISMISASFCSLSRIEFIILFVQFIVIFVNLAITNVSRLILFLLALLINFLLLVIADRLIGFPSITFDSFSINDLFYFMFSSDFNGLIIISILIIPFFWPFTIWTAQINKFIGNDFIYIISLFFIFAFAIKLHVSSLSDSFLIRTNIIRFVLILILGKIVCFQKSVLATIILFVLYYAISMIFSKYKIDDIKLYHFFVN